MWRALHYLSSQDDYRTSSFLGSAAQDMILSYMTWGSKYKLDTTVEWQNLVLSKDLPMVDWEHHADMQSFTILHQIVAGISTASLDVELQGPIAVDRLDKDGRSALWYAVTQRKLIHVCRLLEQGADPSISEPSLLAAIDRQADYEIAKVLLRHGASMNQDRNLTHRGSVFPWCIEYWRNPGNDSLAVDRLLVDHGVKINGLALLENRKDKNILRGLNSRTQVKSGCKRLEQLISLGADLEIADKQGRTAIMYAVMTVFAEAFRVLAGAGARLDLKTATGSTILHLAVVQEIVPWSSDDTLELCRVMCDFDLTIIDLDAKDEDGNTAYELLRIRNGPDWDKYFHSKGFEWWLYNDRRWIEHELRVIEALEELLHHMQDIQGVPKADQYPPLGGHGGDHPDDQDILEVWSDQQVPGAWPAYED